MCVCLCVNMCSEVLGLLISAPEYLVMPVLALWLSHFASCHSDSQSVLPHLFQDPPLLHPRPSPPPNGFILLTCPLHLGLHHVHLT